MPSSRELRREALCWTSWHRLARSRRGNCERERRSERVSGLLLPAASECSINLHESPQLVELRLRNAELCREHPGVAVQHLQIARRATPISDFGQPPRVRGRATELQLLLPKPP